MPVHLAYTEGFQKPEPKNKPSKLLMSLLGSMNKTKKKRK